MSDVTNAMQLAWLSAARRVTAPVALALAVLAGVVLVGGGVVHPGQPDTDAYWGAALRLRESGPLYPAVDPNADDVFRYAPWFAWMWVPLTYLPQKLVYDIWTGLLLACSVITVAPLLRRGAAGVALAALVFGALVYATGYGNPTPMITAGLVLSRVHPVAVGVAASLKGYPLLLAAGFAGERRWQSCAVAALVAAVLWLPALAYGLGSYAISPGSGGISLWGVSRPLWALVAMLAIGYAGLNVARGKPQSWLAGPVMILFVVPRIWPSDLGYLAAIVLPYGDSLLGAARLRRSSTPVALRTHEKSAPEA